MKDKSKTKHDRSNVEQAAGLDRTARLPDDAAAAGRGIPPSWIGRALVATAALSVLAGLVVGPIISGRPAEAANPTTAGVDHTVTVSGSGDVSVTPDVADVYVGVQVQKPTVAEAQAAQATAMNAVIASIRKNGVADKDITTTNLSLTPVYDYSGSVPRLVGQQYSNTVKVTVRDLTKIPAVVDGAVGAGATTIQGISFRLNDPKTVESQARELAMADAKAKAQALTSSAGVSIVGVASISETATQTPVYYSGGAALDVAKSASTPIQSGTTDVVVDVTVSYLIG
jgi:uncharacterized protein YggE